MPKRFLCCFAAIIWVSVSCTHSNNPAGMLPSGQGYTYEVRAFDSLGTLIRDSTVFFPIISQGTLAGVPDARLVKWFLDTVGVADLPNGDFRIFERPLGIFFGKVPDRFWITYPLASAQTGVATVIYSIDTTYPDLSYLGLQDTITVRGAESVTIGSSTFSSIKFDEAVADTTGGMINNVPIYFGSSVHYNYSYAKQPGFFTHLHFSSQAGAQDFTLKSFSR